MGLSGRKQKQRIGADPRNLTWADNAAKFGQSYLSKLGWDPAKGLGANQDGRTSHIQVAQKLNMLGIGAGAPQGPDAIAWKQNRDYELLLKRLNEGNETGEREQEEGSRDDDANAESGQKRKREGEDTEAGDDERKRAKKEKKEKKEKAKKEKEKKEKRSKSTESLGLNDEKTNDSIPNSVSDSTTQPSTEPAPVVRRHLAHRARFLRSKQLASQSSTAVAEILGISPSVSGSATPTPGPSSSVLTPTSLDENVKMEQLTNSNKSVADYFKEKLAARSKSASGTATPTVTAPSGADVKDGLLDIDRGEDKPTVRFGIGANRLKREEEEQPRMGLGSGMKFGNLMGGLGMSFTPSSAPAATTSDVEAEEVKSEELDSEEILKEKKSKKEKKEKKKDKKSKKGKELKTSELTSDGDENDRTGRAELIRDTENEAERKERKRKEKAERKAKKEKSIKDGQSS